MMANWDLAGLWRDLPQLAVPLDLAVGSRDATVAPAQAHHIAARLPGTTIHTLPGLGHLAHEEDPVGVGRWLIACLQQGSTSAPGAPQSDSSP
jgi:magnesium chelatase accessory protein